jgi:DNA-binding LytR/AlgR family response regulator
MNTGKLTEEDVILVGEGGRAATVRVRDISMVEVNGNELTVRKNSGEALTMRGSLTHWRCRLPASFFTTRRNCIVNLAEVGKVNMAQRTFILTMKDGTVVEASRERSRALRKELSL